MQEVNVLMIIGFISTFICLLLAFFLFSISSKNKLSNRLLAFFLLLNAVEFSGWFYGLIFNEPNNLLVFKSQLSYLTLPVFYLYILSVCYSDFKLQGKHLWHGVPFMIGNLVAIPRLYSSSVEEKVALFVDYVNLYETVFMHISLHLQSIFYIFLGFLILKKAKQIFVQNYSSDSIQMYRWIFQLLLFMSAFYGIAIVKNTFKYLKQLGNFQSAQIALSLVVLLFVCWYVLKALRHPNLFNGVGSKTKIIHQSNGHKNVDTSQLNKIRSFMETEKPYLDASLTLRSLAEQTQMNSRDLSVLINTNLQQHFFDFVNAYRIKEAQTILQDPSKKEFTILEILYEVGFNSKSSFNTAFKKHTGKTPTEFRKSI